MILILILCWILKPEMMSRWANETAVSKIWRNLLSDMTFILGKLVKSVESRSCCHFERGLDKFGGNLVMEVNFEAATALASFYIYDDLSVNQCSDCSTVSWFWSIQGIFESQHGRNFLFEENHFHLKYMYYYKVLHFCSIYKYCIIETDPFTPIFFSGRFLPSLLTTPTSLIAVTLV